MLQPVARHGLQSGDKLGFFPLRSWRGNPLKKLLSLLIGWSVALPLMAAAPQEVSFPGLDGALLKAWLLLPGAVPKGSVVALHGCGGLYATSGARKGQLNARHQAMADILLAQGYAVVFADSFTPRGLSQICTQKMADRSITQTERRRDALATLNWVAAQPWATPSKIAMLGWSHGGSAVLAATDRHHTEVAAQAVKASVAIAFYSGCSAARKAGYQPNTRLLMLLGAQDDWTPPGPCIELGRAVGAEVHVYPDSYHDFDNPVGAVTLRRNVPNGVNPGQGVHAGPNAQAREQAYARLLEVLRVAFD